MISPRYKEKFKTQVFLTLLLILLTSGKTFAQPNSTNKKRLNTDYTDYSNLQNWAAHPWTSDPSDSIPEPLQDNSINDSLVDVFFIHPTTYTDKDFITWNASVDDKNLNKKTDLSAILYQASAFNEHTRVFAPRYRQAHINSFYINADIAKKYFDTAYEDVRNAFIYYLENYNRGRPIIIASHSQGTKHAGRLLKEFFDGKLLQSKLICAYIIGMPIPDNYFTELKPCENENATGCFVGWRTYKKGYEPESIKKETFKSVVVNPLTWKINDSLAPANLNKGGVLIHFNKIVPAVVNAKIYKNILWSSKPDVFGKIFITKKNYHIGDINLFYMNIRENVRKRISAYWKL